MIAVLSDNSPHSKYIFKNFQTPNEIIDSGHEHEWMKTLEERCGGASHWTKQVFPPGLTLPSEHLWKGRGTPGHHAPLMRGDGKNSALLGSLAPPPD